MDFILLIMNWGFKVLHMSLPRSSKLRRPSIRNSIVVLCSSPPQSSKKFRSPQPRGFSTTTSHFCPIFNRCLSPPPIIFAENYFIVTIPYGDFLDDFTYLWFLQSSNMCLIYFHHLRFYDLL